MIKLLTNKFSAFSILVIGIVVSLAILLGVIIYSFIGANQLFENFKWVNHTYKVQSKLEIITSLVSEAESVKRGFLITGQKEFLTAYNHCRNQITHEIVLLEELKRNDKPQLDKIYYLENLILQRLQSIDSLIVVKIKNPALPLENFTSVVMKGKEYMKHIKVCNTEIALEEERLLVQRENLAYTNLRVTKIAIIAAGFWSVVIVGLVIFIFRKDVDRTNRIAKELRELDAQKNKFFSIISHDLRNPVNAVKQLSGFLKTEQLPESEVKVIGKMIDDSILKVSNLLEDLLKWGRLQMNRIEFKLESFDLSELLNESIVALQQTAVLKNISIHQKLESRIMVHADRNMIQTVIRNLLSNAIKFTSRGGLIEFTTEQKFGFVKLSVTDNGVGMATETMQKLFRIDTAQSLQGTDNEIGTGLGLILCKEFTEKNGGKIEVVSTLGKGTRITISIPLV